MGIHVKKLGYREEGRIERKEEKRKEGMSICKNRRKEGIGRKKKEGGKGGRGEEVDHYSECDQNRRWMWVNVCG